MNDGTKPMALVLAILVLGLALLAGLVVTTNQTAVRKLRAAQAELDRELAEKKELADNLNVRRREMDALEQRLADGIAAQGGESPEVAAALATAGAAATAGPAASPRLEVPETSVWEWGEVERRRALLADTRRRIAELEKVIGEVNNIEKREAEVEAKLAALERLRARRTAPDGGAP